MKTFSKWTLVVVFMAGSISVFAQPGNEPETRMGKPHFMSKGIPNLSEEQESKIKDLRLSHQKEMLLFRNQMGELKAKQQSLATADKADMKAINQNIDAISQIQNQMMKKRAEHLQKVRSLLTDEQRFWFDTHTNNVKSKKMGHGKKNFRQYGMHRPMEHKPYMN